MKITSYNPLSKVLHWLIGLAIIAMLAMGFLMDFIPVSPAKFQVYAVHKSLGLTILALVAVRYLWNLTTPTPMLVPGTPRWQAWAAHATHAALYVAMVLMPVSGWLMSSAAGFPVEVWGLFVAPDLVPSDAALRHTYAELHELIAYTFLVLLPLHAGAALYHHVIKRDATLQRMLPLPARFRNPA